MVAPDPCGISIGLQRLRKTKLHKPFCSLNKSIVLPRQASIPSAGTEKRGYAGMLH